MNKKALIFSITMTVVMIAGLFASLNPVEAGYWHCMNTDPQMSWGYPSGGIYEPYCYVPVTWQNAGGGSYIGNHNFYGGIAMSEFNNWGSFKWGGQLYKQGYDPVWGTHWNYLTYHAPMNSQVQIRTRLWDQGHTYGPYSEHNTFIEIVGMFSSPTGIANADRFELMFAWDNRGGGWSQAVIQDADGYNVYYIRINMGNLPESPTSYTIDVDNYYALFGSVFGCDLSQGAGTLLSLGEEGKYVQAKSSVDYVMFEAWR